MKKLVYLLSLAILVMVITTSCKDGLKFGSKAFEPADNIDSISYSIGMDIAKNFIKQEYEINPEAMAAGYKEYVEENSFFTDEEKDQVLNEWQQQLQMKEMAKQQEESKLAVAAAEPNKKAGAEFLAENKKKDGVVETVTGLQYKIIKAGSGSSPQATDEVTVHYRGKLIDGTVFDASYDRGEPVTFPLDQVIPGWTEGVQLMKKGAIYEMYIKSDLAYGDMGRPDKIPGGATLIFEVELISFKAAETPAQ